MFLLLFLPLIMAKIDSRDGTININELGTLLLQFLVLKLDVYLRH